MAGQLPAAYSSCSLSLATSASRLLTRFANSATLTRSEDPAGSDPELVPCRESVAASVEVQLASQSRPYSAGLFFDYQISPDPRFDGMVTAGR